MSAYIDIAKQFGDLIAKSNYKSAHALLTKEAQSCHQPEQIQDITENIAPYVQSPATIRKVLVLEDHVLEDWPEKQEGDVARAYIGLEGDGFVEAVIVTIAKQENEFRIRDLEWGRP